MGHFHMLWKHAQDTLRGRDGEGAEKYTWRDFTHTHTHIQFCIYHTDPYTYVQGQQRDQREPITTWGGGEGSWEKGG